MRSYAKAAFVGSPMHGRRAPSHGRVTALALAIVALALLALAPAALAAEPEITETSVEGVSLNGAKLTASVDPNGEATTWHFEYVDDASYQASQFATATRAPAADASAGAGDEATSIARQIEGLSPATTYHYRLVATNASSSSGGTPGPAETFRTYTPSESFGSCPNDQYRTGAGANLPDCRAYEQVSPSEKYGYSVTGKPDITQAALDGNGMTFYSPVGLPGSTGVQWSETALARRGADGWSTAGILPPTAFGSVAQILGWTPELTMTFTQATSFETFLSTLLARDSASGTLTATFQASGLTGFQAPEAMSASTPDGAYALIQGKNNTTLTSDAVPKKPNLFLWDRAANSFSLVGVLPDSACGSPPCRPAQGSSDLATIKGNYRVASVLQETPQEANALSTDGNRAYFNDLTEGAIYMREGLTGPDPVTVAVSASQATTPDPHGPLPASMQFASTDGATALFTSCERLTDDSTAVSTTAKACNTASQTNDLYRWQRQGTGGCLAAPGCLTDLTPDTVDAKGADVRGVLGISDDASYVYFAANGVLATNEGADSSHAAPGSCEGSPPSGATFTSFSGVCNLYVYHDGSTTFIARLDTTPRAPIIGYENGEDKDELSLIHPMTQFYSITSDAANCVHGGNMQAAGRVSADGKTLVFSSQLQQTSYATGNQVEFYRYEAGAAGVRCVTCNPTGAFPAQLPWLAAAGENGVSPPPWEGALGSPSFDRQQWTHNIAYHGLGKRASYVSTDGTRIFFETTEKLVATDTNGDVGCPEVQLGSDGSLVPSCQDVYEWEKPGTGTCTESTSAYSSQDRGCIYLISTGRGSSPVFFGDASRSGDDAFIFTIDRLVPQDDDDLFDVYDARVGGGFESQQRTVSSSCSSEGCRGGATASPDVQAPTTAGVVGPGNLRPTQAKHRKHRKSVKHKKRVKHTRKRGGGAKHRHGRHPRRHGRPAVKSMRRANTDRRINR